ncbi:MAG: hypothetical protein OXG13_14940 [Gemmatimonadaceae bacterium]|nr:hypothetical protein [Gemmatimonadaceae bacterium]
MAIAIVVQYAQPLAATADISKVDSLGVTVRDSLSQGLVVWAVNAYCPSRNCEASVQRLEIFRPDILETAFGDEQAGGLEERLEDLHVQVLEGLRARIARGILRKSDWRGLYEVSLTFLDLKVRRLHEQNLEERRAVRVGVQVILSTRFVLREVETGDRLHSEVIAARRARYFGGEQIEFRDLLEETVTSAYKTLSAKYDSLSASPGDR